MVAEEPKNTKPSNVIATDDLTDRELRVKVLKKLRSLNQDTLTPLFTKLEEKNPELAEQCRQIMNGDIQDDHPEPVSKISSTHKPPPKNALVLVPRLNLEDDIVSLINLAMLNSDQGIKGNPNAIKLKALNFACNFKINKEQVIFILGALHQNEWTQAEFDLACALIPGDYEALKESGFEQMIGLRTFAFVRQKPEVMIGRLWKRIDAANFAAEQDRDLGVLFEHVIVEGELDHITPPVFRLRTTRW